MKTITSRFSFVFVPLLMLFTPAVLANSSDEESGEYTFEVLYLHGERPSGKLIFSTDQIVFQPEVGGRN